MFIDLDIRASDDSSGGRVRSITLTVDEARVLAVALAGLVALEAR